MVAMLHIVARLVTPFQAVKRRAGIVDDMLVESFCLRQSEAILAPPFPNVCYGARVCSIRSLCNTCETCTTIVIADNLSKACWSWGYVSAVDSEGRTIWIADAHRDDGKRFVVRADEKLTAFVELESAIRATAERPEDFGARKITLDNCRGSNKCLLDFVIRQFQLIFGTAE